MTSSIIFFEFITVVQRKTTDICMFILPEKLIELTTTVVGLIIFFLK